MKRLTASFFERDPVTCARELVGARLVWHGCEGRIVETEAYAASGDGACHTAFRPTARSFVESHGAGTAYVYLGYGVHWLFNVLAKGPGGGGFVLVRALEPLAGLDRMIARRGRMPDRNLCAGPGKLTRALGIDGSVHGASFLDGEETGIESAGAVVVAAGPRIGISRDQDLPWRFFDSGSACVSK